MKNWTHFWKQCYSLNYFQFSNINFFVSDICNMYLVGKVSSNAIRWRNLQSSGTCGPSPQCNSSLHPSNTQILVQYWCHIFPILNVVVTLANFRQHITDICPILSNWCLPILAIQYSPTILYQYVSPLFQKWVQFFMSKFRSGYCTD